MTVNAVVMFQSQTSPPSVAIVDKFKSEWLGGGRFFVHSKPVYEPVGAHAYVARAAAMRAHISLDGPVFYALERLGWLTAGVDWALVRDTNTATALKQLAKRYDILLITTKLLPILRGGWQLNLGSLPRAAKVVLWFVEPDPFSFW